MIEEEPMPGEDAQQFHDRMRAENARTPEQVKYAKSLLFVKTKTVRGLVETVMERHYMTLEQAEEALINTGHF